MDDPYSNFVWAIKSPYTRNEYVTRLKRFFKHIQLNSIQLMGSIEQQSREFMSLGPNTQTCVIQAYIQLLRKRVDKKELVWATLRNQIKPIKLFCEMNDIEIKWDKILRGLPSGRRYSHDRAPTIEEIRRVVEYPDRRIKVIVYMMCSGGFRVGAWDFLKWGHVEAFPMHLPNGAKVRIYAGEEEEYFTFITPEAYKALSEYMEFRMHSGEEITEDSWVMRNMWDAREAKKGKGNINTPNKLAVNGIRSLVMIAIREQGLRTGLNGKRRYDFKALHGFRKYFKTHAEQVMKPINVETLMGHSTGISDSYYRPPQKDLIEDYLKAIPLLTINEPMAVDSKQRDEEMEKKLEKMARALISAGLVKASDI